MPRLRASLKSHTEQCPISGSSVGSRLRLHLQQRLLSFHPPAIPTHFAILAHHPMARNGHSHRIRSATSRNGTSCPQPANCLRYLAIGTRCPKRNRLQISPDPPLKRRRPNVKRQGLIELFAAHLIEQCSDPRFQSAL